MFTIFSQQILVDKLLQVFNLNLQLKLLFYLLVTVNNKLTHKICYENIVNINIAFLLKFWPKNFRELQLYVGVTVLEFKWKI